MTIQNQQPQQPFMPPSDASRRRLMPAKVYQQQRTAEVEGYPTSPGPTPAQKYREQEPLVPALPAPRPKRRRLRVWVVASLLLLTGLVGVGSFFATRFFQTGGGADTSNNASVIPGGSFVRPPLSPTQVKAIMHLSGYMKDKALASLYVSHMTLDEELGQLIMVEYAAGCDSGTCANATSYYSTDLDTMINKLHAGGVIMYEFQMQNFNQTKNDLTEMQSRASIPLLISTDEEGGPYVHRLSHIYGYRMSATDIANTGDPKVAAQQGVKAAHDLLSLGINEDLAPDVDVNLVNGYDMVTRTFGNTPQSVITYAGAYMKALQGDGVVACIKHYPGLGDAVPDAHTTLPVVNRTKDQIYSVELDPFKAFIQSPDMLLNPGMIMPTDVLMPAIDPVYPAELSHIFMTDILRKQFGYDGVVLTDALYMQGIIQKWNMYQAAVLALQAGNDMLLGPNGTGQMIEMLNAIKQALKDGRLTKARIDEAATRIIALKMQYHLMPAIPPL